MSAGVFRRRRIVAAEDVDGLGHVNNAIWVRFVVELAHVHSTARGFDPETVRKLGGIWLVSRHEIDYRRPATRGEEILEETWIVSLKGARSVRHSRFSDPSDSSVYVTAVTHWAFTDPETLRPRRIPAEILKGFGP